MNSLIRLLPLILLLTLGACATVTREPLPEGLTDQPPADWAQRQQQLQALDHWQLQGKLAVRQPSGNATAVINRWTQKQEHYDLALSSSFLGMGRTEISGSPGYIELRMPDGERYSSSNPPALIDAATGWQLPIDSLVWWVRGLPAPAGPYRLLFDDRGRLAAIRQQGWEIQYERWRKFMDTAPELPARLSAVRDDRLVRVAVTGWQRLD